jgi:S1-C subfamily serine protease
MKMRPRPLAIALLAASLAGGCLSPVEPTLQDRRSSFRAQKAAFKADGVNAILQTCLVLAAGPGAAEPGLDPRNGGLSIPAAPEGTYTQGLCVGVDTSGYLLTAAHVLRERNWVVGWMGGTLRILPARVVLSSGPPFGGADIALIRVEAALDYVAGFGGAPAVGQPVFAVVCVRRPKAIGGSLELAGGRVLGGASDTAGGGERLIRTDVPLWHGDSGGPLLSGAGELIGINSAIDPGWPAAAGILGDFRRVSYFSDERIVRRAIAADGGPAAQKH